MHIIEGNGQAGGFRFALVVSKYHDFVAERLQAGALAALAAAGAGSADVDIVRVPGRSRFRLRRSTRPKAAASTPSSASVV